MSLDVVVAVSGLEFMNLELFVVCPTRLIWKIALAGASLNHRFSYLNTFGTQVFRASLLVWLYIV